MFTLSMKVLKPDDGGYHTYTGTGIAKPNRTNYLPKTQNPQWNCKLDLAAVTLTGCIVFGIWDYNSLVKNKTMGYA